MIKLGLPLMVAQILQMANGIVDTFVAGKINNIALGSVGIGSSLVFIVSLISIGFLAALSPIFSRHIGAGENNKISAIYQQGIWLSITVGLLSTLVLWFLKININYLSIDTMLVLTIDSYISITLFSILPFSMFMAIRNLFEAASFTKSIMFVAALSIMINFIMSIGLGLGKFGMPNLGVNGIAIATTTVTIIATLTLFLLTLQNKFSIYNLYSKFKFINFKAQKQILKVSIPILFAMLAEAGLFTAVTVQMGALGVIEAAANSITLNAASLCFMLPLGLSFALTARVSNSVGRGDVKQIKLRIQSGAIIAIVIAVFTSLLLVLFNNEISNLFSKDLEVTALASSLILLAAIFQIFDTTQVVFMSSLRGLQDTKVPMYIVVFSFWALGFSSGFILAHYTSLRAHGLWIGLIISLSFASVLLGIRLNKVLKDNSYLGSS